MFKKKIVALVVLLCTLLTLCSCGADKVNYLTLMQSVSDMKDRSVSGTITLGGEAISEISSIEADTVSISYEGIMSDDNFDLTCDIYSGDLSYKGHIILSNDVAYISKDAITSYVDGVAALSKNSDEYDEDDVNVISEILNAFVDNIKEDYISYDISGVDGFDFTNKDYSKLISSANNFITLMGKNNKIMSKKNGWYNFNFEMNDETFKAFEKTFYKRHTKMIPATIDLYKALADVLGEKGTEFNKAADDLSALQSDKSALKARIAEWKKNGVSELDCLKALDVVTMQSSVKKDNNGYSMMMTLNYNSDDKSLIVEYEGTVKETEKRVEAPKSVKSFNDIDIFNMTPDKGESPEAFEPVIDTPVEWSDRDVSTTEKNVSETKILSELDKALNKTDIDKVMKNIVKQIDGNWEDDFESNADGYTTKVMAYDKNNVYYTTKLTISTMGYNDFDYSVSSDKVSDFDTCFKDFCKASKTISGLDLNELDDVKRALQKIQSDKKVNSYVEVRVDAQRLCTIYLDVEESDGVYLAFTYEYSYE